MDHWGSDMARDLNAGLKVLRNKDPKTEMKILSELGMTGRLSDANISMLLGLAKEKKDEQE